MLVVRVVRGTVTEPTTTTAGQQAIDDYCCGPKCHGDSAADPLVMNSLMLTQWKSLNTRSLVTFPHLRMISSPQTPTSPNHRIFHPNFTPLETSPLGDVTHRQEIRLAKRRPTRRCAADVDPLFLKRHVSAYR